MCYYVYILIHVNKKDNPTYVGYTRDLTKRLKLHNSSKGAKFTRGRFWKIIYKKKYKFRSNAMKFEYALKHNKLKRVKIKENFLKNL